MANDVGPLTLPQPLKLFLHWQNSTAQSHCHQHNIEASPAADSVYTSTTTDLLYLEKEDIGVTI